MSAACTSDQRTATRDADLGGALVKAQAAPALRTPLASPLSASSPPTGRAYVRLVVVLGLLIAIGPLTIDTYLPALPELSEELGASQSQAQLTLTGIMIGLGLGQLVLGPLSDAIGRRKVLLSGLVLHGSMSVLCALAPTIGVLTAVRVGQGVAGAAISVVAMAVVRDLYRGRRAAALLSHLTLVLGAAPILAPTLGGYLLAVTSWRGIFVVLLGVAVALVVLAFVGLPETLPQERRRPLALGSTVRTYGGLLRDRPFVGLVLVAGLMFSVLFTYVSGSSFVFQEFYGLDQQQFGLVFGLNAAGLIAATQVNPFLLRRFSPQQVLSGALVAGVVGTSSLFVAALAQAPLWVLLVPLAATVASCGLSFPNSPALALSRHGESAGTAAALLGAMQFGMSGLITPLEGVLHGEGAVPMAALMVSLQVAAVLALVVLVRPWSLGPVDVDDDAVVAH